MCRFNATAPLPSISGGAVPVDGFDDAFNWFDAIDAIELEEEAACEPTAPYQQEAKFEQTDAAGVDLVGWFQQQICPDWTGVVSPAGVGSARASTDVAETTLKPEGYVVENPVAVAAAVPTSSCSVEEEAEEDQPMSNDSSASPSMQKMNNTAGMDRPLRQCQYASRHRAPRINYSEVDDKVERVKQKRRESAQRSRARKNAYMKELETENAGLRAQIAQLQQIVNQLQGVQYLATVPAVEQPLMV